MSAKFFPRKNLAYAWAYSHNTAYLIYPENAEVPKDRFATGIRGLLSSVLRNGESRLRLMSWSEN